jgi:MoaA/NifB/PqqE/SkfB family radical SAM enzyme
MIPAVRHIKAGYRFVVHKHKKIHPFEVQAQLLNACNLRCVYCRCPEVKTDLLSTDEWRDIIKSLGKHGTMRIKFQGGEPTLRKDFKEICAEAKRAGMITAAVTHGGMIASQPDLVEHLDELVVSLDSANADRNDRLRGAGSFQKAVKAIEVGLSRGLRTFVNMTVCKDNLPDVQVTLEFCEKLGVLINIQPVKFGRDYYDDEARYLSLTHEQIRNLHTQLVKWKKEKRGLLFSARAYQKGIFWPDTSVLTVKSESTSACMGGRHYIHIEANGDVLPCIQHGANFVPENILKDGFVSAIHNARHHDCGDCWTAYLTERKLSFGLNPSALREMIRRERMSGKRAKG